MKETEVIIVNGIDSNTYLSICRDAVSYAIISIPFTFNRMGVRGLNRKITNIAKGKLAEGLFFYFCESNGIPVNNSVVQTPFYLPDKADFILQNMEWDIKNNFLFHKGDYLFKKYYKWLPALIPNNSKLDQWSRRDRLALSGPTEKRFLFTFLKGADELGSYDQLIQIHLSRRQEAYLAELYQRFKFNRRPKTMPIDEPAFWRNFFKEDNPGTLFKLAAQPPLIITGFAGKSEWSSFKDSGKDRIWNDGLLRTVINNSYARIHKLPAFASLFPSLKIEMKLGQFSHPKGRKNPFLL